MKIALTNLGKYVEGTLDYTWLTLPFTDEELAEAKKKIGIGKRYEEWFITDYEAPFEIGEYDSLERLNKIAEKLVDIDALEMVLDSDLYHVEDVRALAREFEYRGLINDSDYHIGDIISDERANEIMRQRVAEGAEWASIRNFTYNADNNDWWHMLDGYGNLQRITQDYLEGVVNDILNEMKGNI